MTNHSVANQMRTSCDFFFQRHWLTAGTHILSIVLIILFFTGMGGCRKQNVQSPCSSPPELDLIFDSFRLVDKLFPQVVKWDLEEESSFYEKNNFTLKVIPIYE